MNVQGIKNNMVNKSLLGCFFLLFSVHLLAQQDVVQPLSSNPQLFYKNYAKAIEHLQGSREFYADNNIVFTSDTLALPFIDDFSTITTREYDYQNALAYAVVKAFGPCLSQHQITTTPVNVFFYPVYQYSFDTVLVKIDSTLITSGMALVYFNGPNCFDTSTAATIFPLPYYRYTKFDTIHGNPTDSTFINGDTVLDVQTLYFKQLNPLTKWIDNYAWVNTTYPINPPTIGVATLDGLDQFGLPYDNSSSTRYGIADYLTSKPIDLVGLSNIDSVYLSFYYQPMGLGDWPNKKDSIIVEMRDKNDGKWYPIWHDTGYASAGSTPTANFLEANILIYRGPSASDPDPFYNGFQFRFKNYASLDGNNDHWHIDYVRLDKNRFINDNLINDIAVINPVPSILKTFSLMPYKQFSGNVDLDTNITMYVRNLNLSTTPTVDFSFTCHELNTAAVVYSSPTLSFTAGSAIQSRGLDPRASYAMVSPVLTNIDYDYETSFNTNPSSSNLLTSNDTVSSQQIFDNLLAYDDGSAERAYGLEGAGIKKMAYEFPLNAPDTLAGIQIYYTHIDVNVSNLVFTIYAWDSIGLYSGIGGKDSVIAQIDLAKPYYVDTLNGWTTYLFDKTYLVHNKFYLGWGQSDNRNLQIGYDMNTAKGHDHIFIYTSGSWKKSAIPTMGSPMIRAILDGNYQGTSTHNSIQSVDAADAIQVEVYPNPAYAILNLKSTAEIGYQFDIRNQLGQILQSGEVAGEQSIDLVDLSAGLYFITLYTNTSSTCLKFVKQ